VGIDDACTVLPDIEQVTAAAADGWPAGMTLARRRRR
jgi:hypothetical protein